MGRLGRLRGRRPEAAVPLADSDALVVVLAAFEPARADSAVLAEAVAAGVDLTGPVLVRHHLLLPGRAEVDAAAGLLADEGYRLLGAPTPAGPWRVRASRVQVLTALSAAQERSRMAGLAQRLDGDALGYDVAAEAAPTG